MLDGEQSYNVHGTSDTSSTCFNNKVVSSFGSDKLLSSHSVATYTHVPRSNPRTRDTALGWHSTHTIRY